MPVVRARDVIRVAERLGFVLDRQRGSHAVYYRARDGARIVIPAHQGKDMKPKTLARSLPSASETTSNLKITPP